MDLDFSDEFEMEAGPSVPQIFAQPPSSPSAPGIRAETVYKNDDASLLGMTQHIPEAGVQLRKPRKFRRTPSGMIDCHHVLRKTFGKSDFKGEQKKIVEAAVLGADVFVVAPTGMGKSLCFQIPAVADRHGITIVISPLLALMKNQVAKLRELGVPAISFTSETKPQEKAAIVKDLESGHPASRLLYITPEKLMSPDFCTLLTKVYEQRELSRLVIDEAHCISEWGHDFRAEYRKLGTFRDRFPDVPIMALTASATPTVQEDIITNLNMSKDHLFKVIHPFNRANLFYEVRYLPFLPAPDAQYAAIHDYIADLTRKRGFPSCGIIYARTRQTCDELAEFLREKGVHARPYHRGVPSNRLDATLRDWTEGNQCDVVVATVCFGMGIDKADVRYIIHFDLPQSFEGYYQETGRAGRDGLPSKCIIYYSREDVVKIKKLVRNGHAARERRNLQVGGIAPSQRAPDSLDQLIRFCESANVCRHIGICRYFGEHVDASDPEVLARYCNRMCDACKYPEKTAKNKASLSSDEFISTQRPMLEREATTNPHDLDEEEDVDGYPVARLPPPGKTAIRETWKPIAPPNHSSSYGQPSLYGSKPSLGGFPRPVQNGRSGVLPAKDGFWHTDSPGSTSGGLMVRRVANGSYDSGSEDGLAAYRLKSGRERDVDSDVPEGPKVKKLRQTVLSSALNTMPPRRSNGPGAFKVPFKTKSSAISSSEGPGETIVISDDDDDETKTPSTTDPILRTASSDSLELLTSANRVTPEPTIDYTDPGSSPVKFDTEDGEVDAPNSQKIPVHLREATLQKFRTFLHKGFMVGLQGEDYWVKLDASDLALTDRSDVLRLTARQLEFLTWSYSVSENGYKERASARIAVLKLFATSNLGAFVSEGSSSVARKKGARLLSGTEFEGQKDDINEIVKALRRQVQLAAQRLGGSKSSQIVSQTGLDRRSTGSFSSMDTPRLIPTSSMHQDTANGSPVSTGE